VTDSSTTTLRLAYDTRVLPWTALTTEERQIIKELNELLREIKRDNENKTKTLRWRDGEYDHYPWALAEKNRRSRVIMIEGLRGAGKTSLLLTLIAGWLDTKELVPKKPDDDAEVQSTFKDMRDTVKPLTPLDFDPLPPELPLYSWIIQAFKPLVDKVSSRSRDDDFLDDTADDRPDETVSELFRKLRTSATVGWTTGLLKSALAKDFGEFLVWQGEQQMDWQKLQLDWQRFLDKLFPLLEKSDGALRCNALIALPIDDLDLQAHRLRELLSALRILRHERLVYVLTGDLSNLEVSLEADFYRSFLQLEPTITEGLRDQITEQTAILSRSLREKVIPAPHTFHLKGLPLAEEAMDWRPNPESLALGEVLDRLWPKANKKDTDAKDEAEPDKEETLSGFLRKRSSLGDHTLLFRPLQAFFDRWGGKGQAKDLRGIVDFLDIALSRQEDPVIVAGSEYDERVIELTGPAPWIYGPVPRNPERLELMEGKAAVYWTRNVDFGRTKSEKPQAEQGPPEHLLALDLVAWKPDVFRIINGPLPTNHPLGLLWTQIDDIDGCAIFPWPMGVRPDCPSKWRKAADEWNQRLDVYWRKSQTDGGRPQLTEEKEEVMLQAWCSFVGNFAAQPDTPLNDHLEKAKKHHDKLSILAVRLSGLSDKVRRAIAEGLQIAKKEAADLEKRSWEQAYWGNTDLCGVRNPYELGLKPSYPGAMDSTAINQLRDHLPTTALDKLLG
jgi:KAP-like P-loop domain-containing protein